MTDAAPSNADIRRRVGDELARYIARQRATLDVEAGPLLDELEALIAAGGKRLRPLFCYWGHRAAGGSDSAQIMRVGAALELLHTFALIHDDVMDRSPLRRSRLSTFRVLAELARGTPHRGDPDRFGLSAAVLTGDLALVLADRLLATAGFPADALARASERFDRMRMRAIAGQYLDLLAAHHGSADEAAARRIGSLKSAGYTVADPLAIGATLATDDDKVLDVLERYGAPLGEAFQIRDDVLGVFGDPNVTGKDRDGDLREGKQTVLVAKARGLASSADRRFLDDHLGRPDLGPSEVDLLREVLRRSGAVDATLGVITDLCEEAKAALDPAVIPEDAAEALRHLAADIEFRQD